MTIQFGPLDTAGRIPPGQQTRVAAFLLSAHGAQARQLALALASPAMLRIDATQLETQSQFCRATEHLSLLVRATSWWPDPALAWLTYRWELAWLPQPDPGFADPAQALTIDAVAFGFALHTAIRPAALLPAALPVTDPFGLTLRRMEVESGRIVQAQLRFLKSPDFADRRDAIESAVDRRHAQIRGLWAELLDGLGLVPR